MLYHSFQGFYAFFNKDLETRAPGAADIKLGDSRTSLRTQAVVMAPA